MFTTAHSCSSENEEYDPFSKRCVLVSICLANTSLCSGIGERCNAIGRENYNCSCTEGYTLVDNLCKFEDHCTSLCGGGQCCGKGNCTNVVGGFECECHEGYYLSNNTCVPSGILESTSTESKTTPPDTTYSKPFESTTIEQPPSDSSSTNTPGTSSDAPGFTSTVSYSSESPSVQSTDPTISNPTPTVNASTMVISNTAGSTEGSTIGQLPSDSWSTNTPGTDTSSDAPVFTSTNQLHNTSLGNSSSHTLSPTSSFKPNSTGQTLSQTGSTLDPTSFFTPNHSNKPNNSTNSSSTTDSPTDTPLCTSDTYQ